MMRFSFVVGLLLWSLVSGTVASASFERGEELYQLGRQDQALAVLRDYVRTAPPTVETARAYALIGRILTEAQQPEEVILYLQRTPDELRSPEIELLHGQALVATGRVVEGLRLLQPLLDESLTTTDRNLLLTALTTAALTEERHQLALYYLQQLLVLTDDAEAILDQAHQLLQNRMADADLEEAAFMWQGTAVGQDALLQLARRALVRQNPELARAYLQDLFALDVAFPYEQEARSLQQRASADGWLNRNSIGVLLPLSGTYASYGELVQQGLELALKEHNRTHFPIRFVYRDTAAGTPAAQLVAQLTEEERVIAVIGPLLSADALEAARTAEQQMVPMLALAQADGVPQVGRFVFRDTMTARQQVEALVDYAMGDNRISFSILYPENRLGSQMAGLFQTRVQSAGGEIVDVISYPEDTNDFREQIEQLLWQQHSRPVPEGKTAGEPPPEYPLPPFHALFIPDFSEGISRLAPQLMFYGIKDVMLLGINGWNSPELINRAGRFLDNAVFVDAFFLQSRQPAVRRFVELYRGEYQTDPSILEAQAFDAATLLLRTVDRSDIQNRDDLRRHLHNLTVDASVTGTRGFNDEGEAIKKLNLLSVRRGRLVELDY